MVDGLNIAAFNIQVFGQTKMSKPEVVEILVKVSILIIMAFDYKDTKCDTKKYIKDQYFLDDHPHTSI